VSWSPDGRRLAAACADKTVLPWDVADLARPVKLAQLAGHPVHATPIGRGQVAHTDAVNAVAFSTTDNTLDSAGTDLTVRLWNIDPGTAIQRICATTQGTLTPETWNQYFPDVPYTPPCQAV
jgi:WD40 repeat protein